MDYWTRYGPLMAKQATLVSSLSSDLERLTRENEKLSAELKDAKTSIGQLQFKLDQPNEQERAQVNFDEIQTRWRTNLSKLTTENQRLKAKLGKSKQALINSKAEFDQQIGSLELKILELCQRDGVLRRENEWLIKQIELAETQSEAEILLESSLDPQEDQPVDQQVEQPAQPAQPAQLAQPADQQVDQPVKQPELKRRSKNPKPHPTGDCCRVPGCGAKESCFWRPNHYGHPEYGTRVCNSCYEKKRSSQRRTKPAKPHPLGLSCQVPGCGAKTAFLWKPNFTDNAAYGEFICNVCWCKLRKLK